MGERRWLGVAFEIGHFAAMRDGQVRPIDQQDGRRRATTLRRARQNVAEQRAGPQPPGQGLSR
jgi:hypothetical protein